MVSGMLVDDAIIILENIYRHVEEGVPLREAIVRGAEEVMWPVTAAIATTVAAFIPMLLVTGTSGEFMAILPKTVILCLLGSLFEALVILPAHYLDFGSRRRAADSLAETPRRRRLRALELCDAGARRRRHRSLPELLPGWPRGASWSIAGRSSRRASRRSGSRWASHSTCRSTSSPATSTSSW